MSRIQTPTVAVNPNVEMVNREAPPIVYQPEPYVPETYFDYEQLTNVLQAGVQAAGTFLEVSLLNKRMQAQIAEQAAKERSDKFRVGLSEAILMDKEAQVGEKIENRYVREYLANVDYDGLDADDQQLYNKTLGERSDEELAQQRKFNSKVYGGMLRRGAERLKGAAMGGDLTMQDAISRVMDEKQAIAMLEATFDPQEIATLKTISEFDLQVYRDEFATVISDFLGEASKYRAQIKKKETEIKIDALVEWSADDVANQFMNPKTDLTQPGAVDRLEEDFNSNIRNIRAVAKNQDRTLGELDLDARQDEMVIGAAERVIGEGSAERVLAFRNMMKRGDGYIKDSEKRIKIMDRLDAEVKRKYQERLGRDVGVLSARHMTPIQTDARIGQPGLKEQQLMEYSQFLRGRMKVKTGIGDEEIELLDDVQVNEMISKHKSAMERQDEIYVSPRVLNVSVTALQKTLDVDPSTVRADTVMDTVRNELSQLGITAGTTEYNNTVRELSRYVDTGYMRQLYANATGVLSQKYGLPIDSLEPNPAHDALIQQSGGDPRAVAMLNADKAQLRVQAKALHLGLALKMEDSMGVTHSAAVANFRSGLVSLIGPNLEGPIPVEIFDAAQLYRSMDPATRDRVFGRGSENGDQLIRFLDRVNSVRGAAMGRPVDELIRSAALEFRLSDPRAGWSRIEDDKEFVHHKRLIDDLTGDIMPDSVQWFRELYASSFFEELRQTQGEGYAARGRVREQLSPLVMPVGRSVLPRQDIGVKGEQYVLDMATVLTGRTDVTFIVAGRDEAGTGFLYALRDFNGAQVTTDASGNPIPMQLYTMAPVPIGVTGRVSLTDRAFQEKVKKLNVERGSESWFDKLNPWGTKTYKAPSKEQTRTGTGWYTQGMAQD